MSNIKFYVLVPVYKTEAYIRGCIDSVLQQTYGNFELIIVDDGTPDRAGVICDEYAAADPRIHVIHKENQGLISARRAGIHYVKTHCDQTNAFFVFLDSDDALRENALQTIADTICRESCDVVVYGMMRVYNGKDVEVHQKKPFVGTITDRRTLYKTVYFNAAYNPLCRKAIVCELMEDTDYSAYYHISRGEDLLQDIPVYKNCKKAVFIPDILYNYTINPGSITQSISLDKYVYDTTVRRKVCEIIADEPQITEADKRDYLTIARSQLLREIRIIAGANGTVDGKKRLFDAVRRDAYSAFLLKDAPRCSILSGIRCKKDSSVILFVSMHNMGGKVARGIRCIVKKLFRVG